MNSIEKQISDEITSKYSPDFSLLKSLFDNFFENHLLIQFNSFVVNCIAVKHLNCIYEYLYENGYIFEIPLDSYKSSQNSSYVYYNTYDFLFNQKQFQQKLVFSQYFDNNDMLKIKSIYNVNYLHENFNSLDPLNKKRFIIDKITEFNNYPEKYIEKDVVNFIDSLIENNLHIFFILLLDKKPLYDYNIKKYVIHYLNDKMQLYAFSLNTLLSGYLDFDIVKKYILNREYNHSYFAHALLNNFKFSEQVIKYKSFLQNLFTKNDLIFEFIILINNINIQNTLVKNCNQYIYAHLEKTNKGNLFNFNEKYMIFEFFKIFINSNFEDSLLKNVDNSIFNIYYKDVDILKLIVSNNENSLNKFVRYHLLFDEKFILNHNLKNF